MASATYLPGPNPEAESKVTPPAIAIIVVAGIAIAFCILGLLFNVLGLGLGSLGPMGRDERLGQLVGGTLGLISNALGLIVYGVALWGAVKMKALQSYGLAVTSAILVMLPCSFCCCFVGIPVGIWALVVLLSADVKSAFRS